MSISTVRKLVTTVLKDVLVSKPIDKTANLNCPKCQGVTSVEIPTDSCLAFYKCESCGEMINTPKDSNKCCVVCEYSDKTCPVAEHNR